MSKMLTETKRTKPFTLLSEIVPEILLEKVIMIRLLKEKNRKVRSGETKRYQMLEYRRTCLGALRAKH